MVFFASHLYFDHSITVNLKYAKYSRSVWVALLRLRLLNSPIKDQQKVWLSLSSVRYIFVRITCYKFIQKPWPKFHRNWTNLGKVSNTSKHIRTGEINNPIRWRRLPPRERLYTVKSDTSYIRARTFSFSLFCYPKRRTIQKTISININKVKFIWYIKS